MSALFSVSDVFADVKVKLLCSEVFAAVKVKLLRSEVWAYAQVKLSLPSLRREAKLHSRSELHYRR